MQRRIVRRRYGQVDIAEDRAADLVIEALRLGQSCLYADGETAERALPLIHLVEQFNQLFVLLLALNCSPCQPVNIVISMELLLHVRILSVRK